MAWNHYCAKNNASGLNQVDPLETMDVLLTKWILHTKTQIFEPTSFVKAPIQEVSTL